MSPRLDWIFAFASARSALLLSSVRSRAVAASSFLPPLINVLSGGRPRRPAARSPNHTQGRVTAHDERRHPHGNTRQHNTTQHTSTQ